MENKPDIQATLAALEVVVKTLAVLPPEERIIVLNATVIFLNLKFV